MGLLAGGLALLPFTFAGDSRGSVLTVEQAKELALLQSSGSLPFFEGSFLHNLLCSKRAGMLIIGPVCGQPVALPAIIEISLIPLAILVTYVLPILLWRQARIDRSGLDRPIGCLLPFALASLILFTVAHVLLFRLYLPGRYAQIPGLILAASALGLLADRLLLYLKSARAHRERSINRTGAIRIIAILCVAALCVLP